MNFGFLLSILCVTYRVNVHAFRVCSFKWNNVKFEVNLCHVGRSCRTESRCGNGDFLDCFVHFFNGFRHQQNVPTCPNSIHDEARYVCTCSEWPPSTRSWQFGPIFVFNLSMDEEVPGWAWRVRRCQKKWPTNKNHSGQNSTNNTSPEWWQNIVCEAFVNFDPPWNGHSPQSTAHGDEAQETPVDLGTPRPDCRPKKASCGDLQKAHEDQGWSEELDWQHCYGGWILDSGIRPWN